MATKANQLKVAVEGREGWDAEPVVEIDDVRIWRTDGVAGVASSTNGRGWVVLDVDGEPASAVLADIEDAVSAAESLGS